ncbi:unnamed protein product [Arctia plantaginis]|uniref:Peptidase S1 domain-containing protein n=1 Tax=Arctia plantaginis TaxID=874455 RepID=A0A8S1AKP7_ARCPL|nr:unnamed protein product [Arctia plantaginis]CAB3245981.1 unnamed protein product [Arctia plantaginis]
MLASLILLLALSVPTFEQNPQPTPISPCPDVFQYEAPNSENVGPSLRWYGVIHLSTENTLHSLWLNIVLDRKADILGNWIGDVTTSDNIDFKIENTTMKINPGPATAMRFFVQYSSISPAPRLQAIRLNGIEICNANIPRPATGRPEPQTEQPSFVKLPQPSSTRPVARPETFETRPVQGRPNVDKVGPVYVRPNNPLPVAPSLSGEDPSQFVVNKGRPNNGYQATQSPVRAPTRRPPPQQEVSTGDDGDYFEGGQPTFIIPSNTGPTNPNRPNGQLQCGKVEMNRDAVPLVVNGTPTLEGQWPWQIALYQTQVRTIDNKYLCGGTLVSHRHVITAAHCVTRKKSKLEVNKNTLTVYLGKHNLRTSVEGVQVRFVDRIIVHTEYNASSYSRDLAILTLREPVTYTDTVRPACLWPENQVDLQNVIGKKGSVVGWGFDETGVATEELSLVEMPVVDQETCLRSYNEFFVRFTSPYTYCAGYRDGTSVCNGDSGGGMVFKISGTWFLRGLVSLSVARQNEYRCDPSHYVIFTDLAKFLPWIKQNVYDF